ncbi:MAG: energy transducer TonB [Rickettsiales bacterium]
MRYLEYLQNVALRTDDRYATPPFFLMLVMALSFHLVLLLGLSFIEIGEPVSIPVKTLMLRLGGAEDDEEKDELNATALAPIVPAAATPVTPPMAKPEAPKPIQQPEAKEIIKAEATKAPPSPKPPQPQKLVARVQPTPMRQSTHSGVGTIYGNTRDARAEAVARYEQLLSAWIEKHKTYPQQAYASGMQGRVLLRIRIDRAGNVLSKRIEQSSGYSLLDSAVLLAMQEASPVPAVPAAYPGGKLLEFRIPIDFKAL